MFNTLLFDLDGTLTNPFEGITGGVLYALAQLGYESPPREELKCFIGPPLFDEFREYFKMDEKTAKEAVRLYRVYYSEKGIYENELTKGARELLSRLRELNKRICLATSKPEPFAVRILERFGLLGYFDFIGAATFDGKINTKEQVIGTVLEKTSAKRAECLMIGDRLHDIEGAHAVGIKCAAVMCGFGSAEEFREYKADFVVEGLIDILEIL